jgi:hypothetical protein
VRFEQLHWTDLDPDLGGKVYQLDLDAQGIRALEHNPQVNIAPTYEERGGYLGRTIWASGDKYASAFDGDLNTVWMASRYLCSESIWECNEYAAPGAFVITLGGSFFIDRLRIISGLVDPSATVRNIRMQVAERFEIRDNREQYLVVPITHDQRVSFIDMTLAEHDRAWEVVEVEVYAKGYVDESSYVSDITDFGGPAAWGEMRWSGFRETGAKLFIQTRSGADEDPNLYWRFTGRGDERSEVTRSQYSKLALGQKAGFLLRTGGDCCSLINSFNDPDEDLLHLDLEKVGDNYQARVTRLVEGFAGPLDAEIIGNRIFVIERSGSQALWEITLPAGSATAVTESGDGALPHDSALGLNYPNPFNPETVIPFRVSANGSVELTVYDLAGQKIRTLFSGKLAAGAYTARWDGRNQSGSAVASGVYLYRLEAPAFQEARRLTLLK